MEPANLHMHTSDIIAAFVDRERIDPSALKAALETAAGRDHLVDLLALREVMAEPAAAQSVVRIGSPWRRWSARLSAVAAAVVVAVAGYQAGALSTVPRLATEAPAERAANTTAVVAPVAEAPAPTSVIYLEPGVDWHQGGAN